MVSSRTRFLCLFSSLLTFQFHFLRVMSITEKTQLECTMCIECENPCQPLQPPPPPPEILCPPPLPPPEILCPPPPPPPEILCPPPPPPPPPSPSPPPPEPPCNQCPLPIPPPSQPTCNECVTATPKPAKHPPRLLAPPIIITVSSSSISGSAIFVSFALPVFAYVVASTISCL